MEFPNQREYFGEVRNVRRVRFRHVICGRDRCDMHLSACGPKKDLLTIVRILPIDGTSISTWDHVLTDVSVAQYKVGTGAEMVLDGRGVFYKGTALFQTCNPHRWIH